MPPLVSSQFSPQFLRQLQDFRNEHFLCDCRLVVPVGCAAEDAVPALSPPNSSGTLEFPAHRLILAASSPFFRNLFALKRQESMTTVNLHCSPECLEVILQFLYSGELALGSLNPLQVLSVAKFCQIKPLEQILSGQINGMDSEPVENGQRATPKQKESKAKGAIKRKLTEKAAPSPVMNGGANFFQKFCNRHSLFGCKCMGTPNGKLAGSEENISEASSVAYLPAVKQKMEMPTSMTPNSPQAAVSPSFSSFIAEHESNKNSIFPVPSAIKFPSPQTPAVSGGSATTAELPLSQKAAYGDANNPRPGYYGPLLPTTSNQLTTAAALASAYLAQSAANASPFGPGNIFPSALFQRSPMFPPPGFGPPTPPSSGATESKSSRNQGVNAMMASPNPAQVPVQSAVSPNEEASITVPNSEKEGWCRNKKVNALELTELWQEPMTPSSKE